MRQLKVPDLQWNAKDWPNIVEWRKVKIHEPAITKEITIDRLKAAVETPVELPKFPLHSTSVERAVRLVTQASSQVRLSSLS